MSTVHNVLQAAIEERLTQGRLIRLDIEAIKLRLQTFQDRAEKNNQELEELLDALECEVDHLERATE